jgi:hypothetical protein
MPDLLDDPIGGSVPPSDTASLFPGITRSLFSNVKLPALWMVAYKNAERRVEGIPIVYMFVSLLSAVFWIGVWRVYRRQKRRLQLSLRSQRPRPPSLLLSGSARARASTSESGARSWSSFTARQWWWRRTRVPERTRSQDFPPNTSAYSSWKDHSQRSASNSFAHEMMLAAYDDDEDWMYEKNYERQQPSEESHARYYGPSVTTIAFTTWTPPPTWAEASKRLLSSVGQLQRTLQLSLATSTATLTVLDRTKRVVTLSSASSNKTPHLKTNGSSSDALERKALRWLAADCSVQTHGLPEGGVMHVYVKGKPRSEWMEHTFESAAAAAQFQTDVIALQLLGAQIRHMYDALSILHQGSEAFAGSEYVLHDTQWQPLNEKLHCVCEGIAWDDLMRCLGSSFPAIRFTLDMIRWLQSNKASRPHSRSKKDATNPESKQATTPVESSDASDGKGHMSDLYKYSKQRLLLGPVDFFRLFVPRLPEDAVPHERSDPSRMEQLLRWRKRVARASVLVDSYVKARSVANKGWKLLQYPRAKNYIRKRLAYDDNTDNYLCDCDEKNVYYEPTVSRDIPCQVRGLQGLRSKRDWQLVNNKINRSTISATQAYTLVAVHMFHIPANEPSVEGLCRNDPVLVIPSLRKLVEENSDLQFFVTAWFQEAQRVAHIYVWVRSLAKGIDLAFDLVVSASAV